MFWRSLILFIGCAITNIHAQSPVANFTLTGAGCIEQYLVVDNQSLSADSFQWDFCIEDFKYLSSNVPLPVLPGLSGSAGSKLVQDQDGNWFGFITGQYSNTLHRLSFGNSPLNTPSVTSLGNPGNLFSQPQNIEIVFQDGNWYGFVGLLGVGSGVVKLSFGNTLSNVPSATDLGVFGIPGAEFWDVRIVSQASDWILVTVNRNANSIVRVNFGNSLSNTVDPSQDVYDTGPIAGANSPFGLDVIYTGSKWTVVVPSYNANALQQLSFGNDILSGYVSEGIYSFPSLIKPYNLRLVREGNLFIAFVNNESSAIGIINLKDLNPVNVPEEVVLNGLPTFRGSSIIRWQGMTILFGADLVNSIIRRVVFENDCGASPPLTQVKNPQNLNYTQAGTKRVELISFNSVTGEQSYAMGETIISSSVAPDITFTSQYVCANNDINFTSQNTSGDITDYNWDFGDTNTSMVANPTHQYAAAADYEVSLQVTATNGCNNLAMDTITIYNPPVANFDLPSTTPICTNQNYLFTNTSTFDPGSNPSWNWEVNTVPTSNDQDLTYAIATPVQHDIKLIASIPGCSSEITQSILTVEEGPLANFTFSNDCEDISVDFTNTTTGTVTGYSWDFGDGNMSTQTNGSNTYTNFGPYNVTLEATNAAGCVNTSVQPITIYSKPQPDFSLDLPPFSCSGSPAQFNDLTPNPVDSNLDTWTWSFGDPANGSSTTRNPQFIYATAGQYNVNLDVTTNFGCLESVQKLVTISESPNGDFSFNPACVNQATVFTPFSSAGVSTWQWKIGTSTYNQQSPTHVFSSPTSFNAELTTTGSNGCITVVSKSINVPQAPSVNFTSANNCAEESTLFTDTTVPTADLPVSRAWQFGTVGTGTGETSTFSFPSVGSYATKLTVTNVSGCAYSFSKNVSIVNSPVASFTATPSTGTPPLTVQLSNTSAGSVSQLWAVNDPANSTSSSPTATFTLNELGQYVVDLTVFNQEGCSDTASKIVSVIIPSLDVELTDLTVVPSLSGGNNLLISLLNKSNFPVNNLKAVIDISGEALISEPINSTIQPGQTYTQVLNTSIIGSKGETKFTCVEIEVDGDIDYSNNKKCVNQSEAIVVFEPYPNPGTDLINLDWVANSIGPVEVNIFDPTGRKVFEKIFSNSIEGLNQATISVGMLHPGIYYVFFTADGTRRSFPYVIRR